jgi:hypothetical protein
MLQVWYIVTSCLLNENNDFLRMVINTVRNDIIGRNETFQCLALTMVRHSVLSFSVLFVDLVLSSLTKKDRPSAGGSHMSGIWGRNNRGKPYPCICREAVSNIRPLAQWEGFSPLRQACHSFLL